MKAFVFISIVAICQAGLISEDWLSFKQNHGKKYKTPFEEHYRLKVFLENKKMIDEHNKNYEQGLVSFHMKMNRFGDLTHEEFKGLMNKYKKSANKNTVSELFLAPENVAVPESIDWRQKGAVTPVKDQGQCGSCWAFSTTGAIEGQYFRKNGKLVSLSEQQLVDCSSENAGCDGGLMDDAFSYIKKAGGLESEESYPYEGTDGSCQFKKAKTVAKVSGFVDIPHGDEEALKKAVATVGPVSVSINAGRRSFQFYSGGVYSEKTCDPDDLDHAVLVVGYGNESRQDYWLVKNSWSSKWGEEGYIKMQRNKSNLCGIASEASYPKV